VWLKWQSACLVSSKPCIQSPTPPKEKKGVKKNKNKKKLENLPEK
jgi:hypothetical protein